MTAQETKLLNAFETTLSTTLGSSGTTVTLTAVTDSASNNIEAPCYLVIEPDSATNREYVLVSAVNIGTKTITLGDGGASNRHLKGSAATSGLSHASGSTIRYVPMAQHFEDLNDRIDVNFNEAGTQIVAGNAVKDEDNMSSNSATHLATQQSIKAYVDTQLTAEDLDVTADSGGPISIDLDSETLDIAGGTGITTTASGNEISIDIDSTVVTESSTDTLTNKTINLENNTAIVEFAVTVANPGSGNRYYLDGELSANIQLVPGVTYRFDQSDSSNSGHPLRLSTTKNGTHNSGSAYTTGVTVAGSAGSSGGYTQIVVDAATADNLYYYCSSHSGMGGDSVISINTSGNVAGSGLSLSANTFAIDIPNLSNEGTADNNDLIIIYDDTASGLKKQTRSAFLSGTGVGNMNSFTISDGATSQTISDGNTITFSGTSNEVEVAVSATDTVTIGLPSSITANVTGNVTGNVSGTAGGLSSTLAVASGGTGATSFADKSVIITQDTGTDTLAAAAMDANGELLIGGTSGPAVATLTAGSNITITNSDGGIEIAAAGGDVTASSTTTFTNKTIDADGTGNSISNIDIGNMTSAVVVTESDGIASNDNDTTLPTSAAVKDYVDTNAGGVSLGLVLALS